MKLVQGLLAAAGQELQEPLRAAVQGAAVDGGRRPGQDIDPRDRHAERQVGGLALQFADDLLQRHDPFLAFPPTVVEPAPAG
jgi:hypothetical protein